VTEEPSGNRKLIEMMALCTANPNGVYCFMILFRGFAVDKELNIVNSSSDGRACIALCRVF
jgi:hypothetical protein